MPWNPRRTIDAPSPSPAFSARRYKPYWCAVLPCPTCTLHQSMLQYGRYDHLYIPVARAPQAPLLVHGRPRFSVRLDADHKDYNVSATPQIADARAIASDFIVTGNDMRAALSDYARTQ